MLIDLAINPFDASVPDMVALARAADERRVGCVWVADHFSGAVVGRSWSRDPFVCLGAIASSTQHVEVGVLVANVVNRHPAQLASAANSLQSVAPGRVRLGVGSGAAPGSRFAVEHEAIGTVPSSVDVRRLRLAATIQALRAIWSGDTDYVADAVVGEVGYSGLTSVVDEARCPPLIVGASSWPTVEVALRHADGVNLRRTHRVFDLVDRIVRERRDGFEVSVLDAFDDVADHADRIDDYRAAGVDRLVLGISAPHRPDRLDRVDLDARREPRT